MRRNPRYTKNNKKENSTTRSEESLLARDEIPERPPQLQSQLAVPFVYRFITTSNFTGSVSISYQMLLDGMFVAGTATTAYQLFDFVMIKKITVRAMGVASFNAGAGNSPNEANVGIEYFGLIAGIQGGGKQKTDSNLGTARPAFVSLKPDPKSQVAQFQASSTSAAFAIRAVDASATAVTGAIVDVHVVLRNSGDVSPAAVAVARAGLTPGNIYFGGLDGQTLAATQLRSAFTPRA